MQRIAFLFLFNLLWEILKRMGRIVRKKVTIALRKIGDIIKKIWKKFVQTTTKIGGMMRRFIRRMKKKFVVGTIRAWRWASSRIESRKKLSIQTAVALLGFLLLYLWVRGLETKATEALSSLPSPTSILKWVIVGGAVGLVIWFVYKMARGSATGPALFRSRYEDGMKAVLGYVFLNIAFGLVWPELYLRAMGETLAFIGVNLIMVAIVAMMANSPRQAEKTLSFMKGVGGFALVLLVLRIFGAPLDPWNWDWSDDEESPAPTEFTSAGNAVARLPRPAWEHFNGPEKERVMRAFPADTVMWAIAGCESRFRQFRADGEVLRGEITPSDVGLYQINEEIHKDLLTSLAEEDPVLYDITTADGNIAVAKVLLRQGGYQPWSASAWCWRDGYAFPPGSVIPTRSNIAGVAGESSDGEVVVVAPAGRWSEPITVPMGWRARWQKLDSLPYAIRYGGGRVRVVNVGERIRISESLEAISFMSVLPDTTVRMRVILTGF